MKSYVIQSRKLYAEGKNVQKVDRRAHEKNTHVNMSGEALWN